MHLDHCSLKRARFFAVFLSSVITLTFIRSMYISTDILASKKLGIESCLLRPFQRDKLKSRKVSSQLSTVLTNFRNLYDFAPGNIIDIGANKGDWSREILKIFPRANFLLCEPNSEHKDSLVSLQFEQGAQGARFLLSNKLLGDRNGFAQYFSNANANTGNSIYRENTRHFSSDNREVSVKMLQMTTLEDLVNEKIGKEECIDFLKIDSQGAELDILRGGKELLPSISILLLEMSLVDYNINGAKFADIFNFLDKNGFSLVEIVDLQRRKGVLIAVDALFVNKKSPLIKKINEQVSQQRR